MNKIVIIVVVVFVAIIGLGLYVDSQKPEAETVDPATVSQIVDQDYVSGNRDAEVVLFKYSDLQCPACAAFNPIVDQVKAEYVDNANVAVVVRDFPLPFHRQANAAAYALRAAKEQGQFDAMQRIIFERQASWSNNPQSSSIFESIAEELGLDMDQFKATRDSDEVRAEVLTDIAKGRAIGVNSTPTFVLNETQVQPRTVQDFRDLIDAALTVAGQELQGEEEVVSATTTVNSEIDVVEQDEE